MTSFPQLTLTKTASISGSGGLEGDVITYTFSVENTGGLTINNIVINDDLTGTVDLAVTPSTLSPGETGTATATYIITAGDIDNGYVQNTATTTGQDPMGIDVNDISDAGNETVETEAPEGLLGSNGDPTDDPTVVLLIEEAIEIHNFITPDDGDGKNDVFNITGLQRFPDNNLKIYNRWGVLVFDQDRYQQPGNELFNGTSNGRVTIVKEEKLPAGVYYYVLTYEKLGETISKAGPLYIKR